MSHPFALRPHDQGANWSGAGMGDSTNRSSGQRNSNTGLPFFPGRPEVSHGTSNNTRGNNFPGNSIPGNSFPGISIPGNSFPGNSFASNSIPGNSFPGNSFSTNSIQSNAMQNNRIQSNSMKGNSIQGARVQSNSFPSNSFQCNSSQGNSNQGNSTQGNRIQSSGVQGSTSEPHPQLGSISSFGSMPRVISSTGSSSGSLAGSISTEAPLSSTVGPAFLNQAGNTSRMISRPSAAPFRDSGKTLGDATGKSSCGESVTGGRSAGSGVSNFGRDANTEGGGKTLEGSVSTPNSNPRGNLSQTRALDTTSSGLQLGSSGERSGMRVPQSSVSSTGSGIKTRQDSERSALSLTSQLQGETDKLRAWKIQTEANLKMKERLLGEARAKEEAMSKTITSLQAEKETIVMKLKQELDGNESLSIRLKSLQDMFNEVRTFAVKAEDLIHQCNSKRIDLEAKERVHAEQCEELSGSFNMLSLATQEERMKLAQKLEEERKVAESFQSQLSDKLKALKQEHDELTASSLSKDEIIVSLRNSLTAKETEVSRLTEDLEHRRAECSTLRSELKEAFDGIEKLKQSLEDLGERLKSANEEGESMKHDNEELRCEVESLKREQELVRSEIESLKGHMEELEHERDSLERGTESMKHEIDLLKCDIESLENERDAVINERDLVVRERESVSMELSRVRDELNEMMSKFSDAEHELENKNCEMSQLNGELADMREKIGERDGQIEELRERLSEREEEIKKQQEKYEDHLQKELSAKSNIQQTTEQQISELEAELNASKESVIELSEKVEQLCKSEQDSHDSVTLLKSQLTSKSEECLEWRSESEELNKRLEEFVTKFEDFEAATESAKEELRKKLQASEEELKESTDKHELHVSDTIKKMEDIGTELSTKDSEVVRLREELNSVTLELKSTTEAFNEAKERLCSTSSELEHGIEKSNTAVEMWKAKYEQLEKSSSEKLQQLEANVKEGETAYNDLESEMLVTAGKMEEMREDLEAAQRKENYWIEQVTSVREEKSEVEARLAAQHSDLTQAQTSVQELTVKLKKAEDSAREKEKSLNTQLTSITKEKAKEQKSLTTKIQRLEEKVTTLRDQLDHAHEERDRVSREAGEHVAQTLGNLDKYRSGLDGLISSKEAEIKQLKESNEKLLGSVTDERDKLKQQLEGMREELDKQRIEAATAAVRLSAARESAAVARESAAAVGTPCSSCASGAEGLMTPRAQQASSGARDFRAPSTARAGGRGRATPAASLDPCTPLRSKSVLGSAVSSAALSISNIKMASSTSNLSFLKTPLKTPANFNVSSAATPRSLCQNEQRMSSDRRNIQEDESVRGRGSSIVTSTPLITQTPLHRQQQDVLFTPQRALVVRKTGSIARKRNVSFASPANTDESSCCELYDLPPKSSALEVLGSTPRRAESAALTCDSVAPTKRDGKITFKTKKPENNKKQQKKTQESVAWFESDDIFGFEAED